MSKKEEFESYQKTIREAIKELSEKMDPDRIRALIWKSKLSFDDYKKWKAGEFKEPTNKKETIDDYGTLIEEVYAKHHASPFTEPFKHNEGIRKAMYEFAQQYHELKQADTIQHRIKSKWDDLDLGELKGKISSKLDDLFKSTNNEPINKDEK